MFCWVFLGGRKDVLSTIKPNIRFDHRHPSKNVQVCLSTHRHTVHSLHVHHAVARYTYVVCHSPGRSINHWNIISVNLLHSVDHTVVAVLFLVIFIVWLCDAACKTRWTSTGYWQAANGQKSAWNGQHLQWNMETVFTCPHTLKVSDMPARGHSLWHGQWL